MSLNLLPGWAPMPLFSQIAPPALGSVSNAGSNTTSTSTLAWPAGVQAGDIAVIINVGNGSPVPAAVTVSGFDLTTNLSNGSFTRVTGQWKKCDGTETGNMTLMNGNFGNSGGIVLLRGNFPITAATRAGALNGAFSSGNPGAITVLAGASTPPTLVIGLYRSDTNAVDPRIFSTTKDGEQGFASNLIYIAWKLYTASPADSQIDMDDEGNASIIQGFYLHQIAV